MLWLRFQALSEGEALAAQGLCWDLTRERTDSPIRLRTAETMAKTGGELPHPEGLAFSDSPLHRIWEAEEECMAEHSPILSPASRRSP